MRNKRLLNILLLTVLLAGMMPVGNLSSNVVQAAGTDTYYLNEDFNSSTNFPTGSAPNDADWSSAGNGVPDTNYWNTFATGNTETVTVEDYPSSSDRSVKITKTVNDTNKAESTVNFTSQPLSGLVVVEASVMSNGSMTGTQVAPYITNGAGTSIVKIQFTGGNIKANNGSSQQIVQAFAQGTWYNLKAVIHTSSNTYDLYIDGISKITGWPLAAASGGTVGKVTFKMDSGNNTGTIYCDNLKIYTTVPAAAVTGLAFDSAAYSIYSGDVVQTAVHAVYSDNSQQALTSGNSFSSLDSNIASIDPTTGIVTAHNQGTTQITVSNSVYDTPASATVIVNPLPALAAPTGLGAGAVTDTLVQLDWSAAPNATKYFIYRAAAGSGLYSKLAESTATSYTDNTVAASTAYDYTVSSVFITPGGQVIESAQSAKASVKTSAATGFVVNDDFNGMTTGATPAGWTNLLTSGAGTVAVADVPSSSDKSLSLTIMNGNDAAEAHRPFSGLTGKVAIEAKVMTTGAQFSVAPYILNNKGKAVMKFGLRNGYIVAIGNKQQINTQPFVPGQWYTLKIVVNTNANTYNLWIDGVPQPINSSDLFTPFDANNTSITEVYFKADNTSSQANCYVDDVKVYTLPPASITGISFDKPVYALYQGDTVNAIVQSVDTDGATRNVTNGSTITSLNPDVATIDATGKITAVGQGNAQLSASYTVGQSVYQAQANVAVNPIPALFAPQGLSVGTVRSTSVTLNWNPAVNATKYSVYRANAGTGQYRYVGQSQPGIATYIDNNVSPGTSYDYKVSSVFITPGGQVVESEQSSKVTAVTAAPPANFPTAAAGYTVKDDFNSNATGTAPSGWVTDASGGTVTVEEVPFAVDKSVMISKSAAANNASAARTFLSLTGKVTIEAKVKAMESTGTKYIPYIYDSNGNPIAGIAFKDNNIAYNKSGTWINAAPFDADKWYILRAVIDTIANKYDLYIDGMKKVSGIPFLSPASDVGKLFFGMDSGNTGTLYFDNIKVYSQATFIGGPPAPVFDVKDYGAAGDGITKDTAAIQAAIDAAAGTGGSVYLHDGTFLSGMIRLKSNMTLYIDSSATLKGSTSAADYPDTHPLTYNTQLGPTANCNKALVYAENVENVTIDGGGTIDGSGDSFNTGNEPTRPMTIYTVLSSNVTMQNLYIKKSGMWTVVNAETDYLTVRNIYLDVKLLSNRDGFDIVDCWHVVIEDVTVNTGDDAICIKSGKRRGVEDVLVRNSNVTASGTNGLKFGTASYGAFKNVRFVDNMVKDVKYCAMCVESVDGADVSNITFQRIDVQDTGNPFFVILGKRSDRYTQDDAAKKGTMNTITFQDIIGKNMNTTWASPISGANMSDGTTYRLQNIHFNNVNITYKGGKTTVPADPPEYALGQYPESNIWSDLPAYGYYVRHADGVTFTNTSTNVSPTDARSAIVMNDVSESTGITLDSTALSLKLGETHPITVTQGYANGDTLDVTGSSSFASSNTGAATVDAAGKVKAVGTGSSVITVTNGVYKAQVNVTVTGESTDPDDRDDSDNPHNTQDGQTSQTGTTDRTDRKGPDVTSTVSVNATLDTSTRTARAEISASLLNNLFHNGTADKTGVNTVGILVPKVDGAKVYEIAIPASFVANVANAQKIAITTPVATIELPGNMLKSSQASASSTITVSVEKVEKGAVSDSKLKDKIGDRPILDIQLKIDGKIVEYDNPRPVNISIPYKASSQEMKDPEHIVVWYIDGNGQAVKVPNGKYDPATGMVTLATTHFSRYAISLEYKTFGDIADYGWAKRPIEVLASKGIINGTSDDAFSPASSITKADFLALLIRTLELNADFDSNFSDISKSDSYYQEVGIARKLGISDGIGNNLFDPRGKISRQDMMVLTVRALKLTQMIRAQGTAADLEPFADKSDAASYAADSISSLVKEGIVTGDGNRLHPRGNATRAEAAVMMYRIFNMR
jgi:polygalacturonase